MKSPGYPAAKQGTKKPSKGPSPVRKVNLAVARPSGNGARAKTVGGRGNRNLRGLVSIPASPLIRGTRGKTKS